MATLDKHSRGVGLLQPRVAVLDRDGGARQGPQLGQLERQRSVVEAVSEVSQRLALDRGDESAVRVAHGVVTCLERLAQHRRALLGEAIGIVLARVTGYLPDLLARVQVRCPEIPIVFAETRPLAEEWTYRWLGAALAEDLSTRDLWRFPDDPTADRARSTSDDPAD
jgi:hypothetical protein